MLTSTVEVPTSVLLPQGGLAPPKLTRPQQVSTGLRGPLGGHVYLCHGGHEFDGRELSPLDAGELRRVAADITSKGLRSIAICSVFSPVNDECEQQAAEILAAELPGVAISRSHEIGRVGLLERENATIINACLRDLAARIVDALRAALAQLRITAPVWLSQNDGTLMSVEAAARYPVATFACGPTSGCLTCTRVGWEEAAWCGRGPS
ncbi:MAG: hydantoinase/oxoprolinase N-terminal domain-containing protein [Pseudonocardiaceae bacterium]